MSNGTCSEAECGRPKHCRTLCRTHYEQAIHGRPLTAIESHRKYTDSDLCLVGGCESRPVSGLLCNPHGVQRCKYSLTAQQLAQLLTHASCEACGSTERLCVDHDHNCCPAPGRSCGKCVRGVLCSACNKALGMLRDDPRRVEQLLVYASSHSPNRAHSIAAT